MIGGLSNAMKKQAAMVLFFMIAAAAVGMTSLTVIGQASGSQTKGEAAAFVKTVSSLFSPPMVTLTNQTGETMRDITISLGVADRRMPNLSNGQSATVAIRDKFGEASTRATWRDWLGTHEETADDYIESTGDYHSKIAITADRKAKVIHEPASSAG